MSHPHGVSGLKLHEGKDTGYGLSLTPHGVSGLKSRDVRGKELRQRLTPHGVSGLKQQNNSPGRIYCRGCVMSGRSSGGFFRDPLEDLCPGIGIPHYKRANGDDGDDSGTKDLSKIF